MSNPLIMHIPLKGMEKLPEIILNEIRASGIDTQNSLKIFLSAQNFPWNKGTVPCFRPHHGTDGPQAPARGTYYIKKHIKTGLFDSEGQGVYFKGHQPNQFIEEDICTHPDSAAGKEGSLILSGDSLHILGLDPEVGQSFWSYVGYHDGNKNKAIVTLHWLLSDKQLEALSPILASSYDKDIRTLFKCIGESPAFSESGEHILKLLPFWDVLEDQI
jgi:hypothetical protein